MVAAIVILSIIDIACTTLGLRMGVIEEGGPIMRLMYDVGEVAAIVFALGVIVFGLWFMCWAQRERGVTWGRPVLVVILAIKFGIVIAHLYWIVLWYVVWCAA